MNRHYFQSRFGGLTIVEAVVTMGIIAVLAAVALPSMQNFLMQQRVKSATHELLSDLQLVRSTALQQTGTGVATFFVTLLFSPTKVGSCYVIVPVQDHTTDCDCARSGKICEVRTATSFARQPVKVVTIDTSHGLTVNGPAGSQLFLITGTGMVDDKVTRTYSVSGGSPSMSLNVVVSPTGISRICAPSGSTISGYPAC